MADNMFSGLSLGDLGDEPEKKTAPESQPSSFGGLSLSDLGDLEGETEGPEVRTEAPEKAPETELPAYEGLQGGYGAGRNFSSADFDTDPDDVLDYLAENGRQVFGASISRGLGSIEAEMGRTRAEAATPSGVEVMADEDAGYLDTLMMTLQSLNPKTFLGMIAPEFAAGGPEQIERGEGVFREATLDLQALSEEADTTEKKIAYDVVANLGTTAAALATAPFRSPALTASALGALTFMDTTQEALEAGEDLKDARGAGFVDAFIETGTELIPLGTLFKMGAGKDLMKDALNFLVQEVGTEMTATALQDLNAKLSYEPDMTLERALDNLARTALSTPFSAGLQVGAVKTMDAVGKAVEERKAPAFTPFDEEVIQLSERAKEAQDEVAGLQGELNAIMEELRQRGEAVYDPQVREEFGDSIEAFQFSEGERTPDPASDLIEQTQSAGNAWKVFPVRNGQRIDYADVRPGEVLRAEQPKVVERAARFLQKAKEQGLPEKDLKPIRKQLEAAKRFQRKEESVLNRVQDLYRRWVKQYAPNMKIVITSSDVMTPGAYGSAMPGRGDIPSIININVRELLEASESRGHLNSTYKDLGMENESIIAPGYKMPETVIHEFGHALIGHKFASQPPEVRRAIEADWMEFLRKYRLSTPEEAGQLLQPGNADSLKGIQGTMGDIMQNPGNRQLRNYLPSFPEFIAHRMVRQKMDSPEITEAFSEMKNTLENFWGKLPKRDKHDKSFGLFLEKLGLDVKLGDARRRMERRVRLYRDGVAAMRRAATTPATTAFGWGAGRVVPPGWNGGPRSREDRTRRINNSVDTFNKFIQYTAGLTHISDMNKHIPGVTNYRNRAFELWQDKMRWTERAAAVTRKWANGEYLKGKDEREGFANFLFAADARSDELGRALSRDELRTLAQQHNVTERGLELAGEIWGSFQAALTEVENAVIQDLQNQLSGGNAQEIAQAIREARRDFARLRNRNYMPHTRFGSYTVTGYASGAMTYKGKEYGRGETVFFGTYPTEKAAVEAKKALDREIPGARFGVGLLDDTSRELLDLPPALAGLLEKKLSLSPEQQKSLTEIRAMLAPGQSFRKRMIEREGIEGYSQDAVRVYSDYMQKFAGHLARIKHVPQLQESIAKMSESARALRQQGGNTVKREKIIQWYEEHLGYMMDPGNELTSLRAVGFLWYLGFNVKSALVNSTQLIMTTYPYLAQQYNDVSATAALTSAMHQVTKAQFTARGMDPDLVRMTEELIQRGTIDESLATELAALSEGGFLSRAPGEVAHRLGLDSPENTLRVQKFFEWGAMMFQTVEKVNRRITAAAAYKLARKSGMTHAQAVDSAQEAVIQTQYEYTRINRPEMMRGPVKSNIFMFWQYLTNTMYFLGQNKGAAARYMIIMFLMAGIEGLPGMGNLLDLTDYAIKKLKEIAGWKDPKSGARAYIRDAFELLEDDPMWGNVIDTHLMMNGVSSRLFGAYDLSASISMGRMIPGTEYLATDLNPQTELIATTQNLAGAMVNIPVSISQAIWGDNPDSWKRAEKAMPSFAQGISQAIRYASRGKEVDSAGATVVEFDWPRSPETWMELLGRGMGMQISRLSEERERRFMSYDAINYWTQRHSGLTSMLTYGLLQESDDMVNEALNKITKFNEQVPFPEMQIQPQNLAQSVKQGMKTRLLRGEGIEEQKKYYQLSERERARYGKED